jgi:hypothetical protein
MTVPEPAMLPAPTMIDLRHIAAALGGEVSGQQVLAPGPGHSPRDRSLAVRLSANASAGFICHSHAGDNWQICVEHVRARLGLPHHGGPVTSHVAKPMAMTAPTRLSRSTTTSMRTARSCFRFAATPTRRFHNAGPMAKAVGFGRLAMFARSSTGCPSCSRPSPMSR